MRQVVQRTLTASRHVHQRIVISHRSQVFAKPCPRTVSIRFCQTLASVHSCHVSSACDGLEQAHCRSERAICLLLTPSTKGICDPRTPRARCAFGDYLERRCARPRYRMLGQLTGAGASIRRFALFGSYGTSWTAMLDATTEPSFRMIWTWP